MIFLREKTQDGGDIQVDGNGEFLGNDLHDRPAVYERVPEVHAGEPGKPDAVLLEDGLIQPVSRYKTLVRLTRVTRRESSAHDLHRVARYELEEQERDKRNAQQGGYHQ